MATLNAQKMSQWPRLAWRVPTIPFSRSILGVCRVKTARSRGKFSGSLPSFYVRLEGSDLDLLQLILELSQVVQNLNHKFIFLANYIFLTSITLLFLSFDEISHLINHYTIIVNEPCKVSYVTPSSRILFKYKKMSSSNRPPYMYRQQL